MTQASDNAYPSVLFKEGASPSNPSSGHQRLFVASADGKLKLRDSGGTEFEYAQQVGTTKGDLYVYNGTTLTRIGVGSDDEVLTADSAEATGVKWAAGGGGGGGVSPLTGSDTVTVYNGQQQSIAADSYHTIFDITSGGVEVLSGAFFGTSAGIRLTIDGTVVIDTSAQGIGEDVSGNAFSVLAVPWAQATTSMKLEIRNEAGGTRDYGWWVFTR